MANPLKQLARLRRYDGTTAVEQYLLKEMRQNLKAIEDAFRKVGIDTESTSSELSDLNSREPYSLYVKKTGSLPLLTATEITVTDWDTPSEERGTAGTFDSTTGEWTCSTASTFIFFARCGVAVNSGEVLTLRLQLDGTVKSTASGNSGAKSGPIVSFGGRIEADQVVRLRAVVQGNTNMTQDADNPIFFNVIQVSL